MDKPGWTSFRLAVGSLAAGNTIYVVIGAGETDVNDGFDLDFTISRF
jgi:hypothetical protein